MGDVYAGFVQRVVMRPGSGEFHEPKRKGGCWKVMLKKCRGVTIPQPQQCSSLARGGRLTCQSHRRDEEGAQAFAAAIR
jgi:hypothetical protein